MNLRDALNWVRLIAVLVIGISSYTSLYLTGGVLLLLIGIVPGLPFAYVGTKCSLLTDEQLAQYPTPSRLRTVVGFCLLGCSIFWPAIVACIMGYYLIAVALACSILLSTALGGQLLQRILKPRTPATA
jgi:hypothetical protein